MTDIQLDAHVETRKVEPYFRAASLQLYSSPGIRKLALAVLLLALVLAFLASITIGSVPIPFDNVVHVLLGGQADKDTWGMIILTFRLPKAITAMLAGAALSVAGLQMQTLFRNPLADPFVLGISSGASLGVALVVLGAGAAGMAGASVFGRVAWLGDIGLVAAASFGAAVVFTLVILIAHNLQQAVALLVLGLMIGYVTSAAVSLLIHFSVPEQIAAYTAWTFGSFGGVTWKQMRVLLPVVVIALAVALTCAKPLNALLLGDTYARSMGLNVRMARWWVTASASILAGVITAYCGLIGFVGVAVPHLTRSVFNTSDHRVLLPSVMLFGATLALVFDLIAQMPGARFSLPLNVVTSFVGAPVTVWVILRRRGFKNV